MPAINLTSLSDAYRISILSGPAASLGASILLSSPPTYLVCVGASPQWIARAHALLEHYSLCGTACYRVDRSAEYATSEQAIASLRVEGEKRASRPWQTRGQRDAEPTFAHMRAWVHMAIAHADAPLGIFLEEDIEMWVPPATLAHALDACVAATANSSIASCYFGGCWGIHASNCDWHQRMDASPPSRCARRAGVNLTLAALSDGSQLLQVGRWPLPTGGQMLTRCVGFYALSRAGVVRVLDASRRVPTWTHPTDHHLNSLAAVEPTLRASWVEPPISCQVRGQRGSRSCFAAGSDQPACPPIRIRQPVRLGARLPGELGVSGCGSDRYEPSLPPLDAAPLPPPPSAVQWSRPGRRAPGASAPTGPLIHGTTLIGDCLRRDIGARPPSVNDTCPAVWSEEGCLRTPIPAWSTSYTTVAACFRCCVLHYTRMYGGDQRHTFWSERLANAEGGTRLRGIERLESVLIGINSDITFSHLGALHTDRELVSAAAGEHASSSSPTLISVQGNARAEQLGLWKALKANDARMRPPVTVVEMGDVGQPQSVDEAGMLEDPRLGMWYANNPRIRHRKLRAFPRGLGNTTRWAEVLQTPQRRRRPNLLLCGCMAMRGDRAAKIRALERNNFTCYKGCSSKYEEHMLNATFVASPWGVIDHAKGGRNNHRDWEALLAGAIPLVDHDPLLVDLFAGLPVVHVRFWEQVTPLRLHGIRKQMAARHFDLAKAFWPYWLDQLLVANRSHEDPEASGGGRAFGGRSFEVFI